MTPPTPPAQHREALDRDLVESLERLTAVVMNDTAQHHETRSRARADSGRLKRYLAAPTPEAERVEIPAGMALVPIEPTKEMLTAFRDVELPRDSTSEEDDRIALRAAIAAYTPRPATSDHATPLLSLAAIAQAYVDDPNEEGAFDRALMAAYRAGAAGIAGESGEVERARNCDDRCGFSSDIARFEHSVACEERSNVSVQTDDGLRQRAIAIVQAEAREMGYMGEDVAGFAEPDGDDLLTVQAVERALLRPPQPSHTAEVEAMREACARHVEGFFSPNAGGENVYAAAIAAELRALPIPSTAAGEAGEGVAS